MVVYTRERLDLNTEMQRTELKEDCSKDISGILQESWRIKVKPAFIVAKGGITSSDIGVKGLKISKKLGLRTDPSGIPV